MHLMAVNRLAKSAADWVLKLRCPAPEMVRVSAIGFPEASLKSCML